MMTALVQLLFALGAIIGVKAIVASLAPNITRIMAVLREDVSVPSYMYCTIAAVPRRGPPREVRPVPTRRHTHSSWAA